MATSDVHKISSDGSVKFFASYCLPPAQAIVNAYEQHNGNFNWWEYDSAHRKNIRPRIKKGTYGYVLGDFWVKFREPLEQR